MTMARSVGARIPRQPTCSTSRIRPGARKGHRELAASLLISDPRVHPPGQVGLRAQPCFQPGAFRDREPPRPSIGLVDRYAHREKAPVAQPIGLEAPAKPDRPARQQHRRLGPLVPGVAAYPAQAR